MPKFTCRGCGHLVWEPENPDEHAGDCPNMARLDALVKEIAERAKASLKLIEESNTPGWLTEPRDLPTRHGDVITLETPKIIGGVRFVEPIYSGDAGDETE